jgi:hypothetical protein
LSETVISQVQYLSVGNFLRPKGVGPVSPSEEIRKCVKPVEKARVEEQTPDDPQQIRDTWTATSQQRADRNGSRKEYLEENGE